MSKDTIIFDLDGTIALEDHRFGMWIPHEPHCRKTDENCSCKAGENRPYYDACDNDAPNRAVIDIMHSLYKDYIILIFSLRSDMVETKTRDWLRFHSVPYHNLKLMEGHKDTRNPEIKLGWAREYGLDQILCVFEDRTRMVEAWRAAGVPCLQVAPGNF
jgi:hypothetical protein